MSSTTLPPAALQFDFENISGTTLPNLTGSSNDGDILTTGYKTGADPMYGGYLQFTHDTSVSLPKLSGTGNADFSEGITITAWVYLSADNPQSFDAYNLFSLGTGDSVPMSLLWQDGQWFFYPTLNNPNIVSPGTGQGLGNWVYLACTLDYKSQSSLMYVGGGGTLYSGFFGDTNESLSGLGSKESYFGKPPQGAESWSNKGSFIGKMAWLSVYNQALSMEQVKAEMNLKPLNPVHLKLPSVVQYDFSSISGQSLTNLAGTEYNGTISEGYVTGYDPQYGDYLEFSDNTQVSIPAFAGSGGFPNGFTLTAWIYMAGEKPNTSSEVAIGSFSNDGNISQLLWNVDHWLWAIDLGAELKMTPPASQDLGRWVYLALSYNNDNQQFESCVFDDGQWSEQTKSSTVSDGNNIGAYKSYIGQNPSGGALTSFHGRLAWFSIYSQYLSKEILEYDMAIKANSQKAALQFDFENISGTTLPNLADNQHNGIIGAGCIQGSDPKYGDFLTFNGSDSVTIDALPGTGADDFSTGLTIGAWINIPSKDEDNNEILLALNGSNSQNFLELHFFQDGFFLYGNDVFTDATSNEPKNKWVYVAATISPSNAIILYSCFDGVWQTINSTIQTSNGTFKQVFSDLGKGKTFIGNGSSGGSGLKGNLAWLSVYNRVLTQEQLQVDMAKKVKPTLPSPTLQYDFKGLSNDTVPSLTTSTYQGNYNSGCSKTTDPTFGECLNFSRTGAVSINPLTGTGLADISNGLTITSWLYQSAENAYGIIFTLNNSTISVEVNYSNVEGWDFSVGESDSFIQIPKGDQFLNQWIYIAMSLDGQGNATAYIYDGDSWTVKSQSYSSLSSTGLETHETYLGTPLSSHGNQGFEGNMAWFSLYNSPLNMALIELDMEQGLLSGNQTYRKSFPLDFDLTTTDVNGNPIPTLFIESQGQGKAMNLSLTNSGTSLLTIPTGSSISQTNYHLQLRFKPGVLSANFLKKSQASLGYWEYNDWHLAVYTDSQTGDGLLNILNTGSEVSLINGRSMNIDLGPVNADPIGGARNTTVMLQYQQLNQATNPISGHRKQTLSIISHLGQKDIPLNASTIEAPRILNNGKSSYLQLRIENTTAHTTIPLNSVAEQAKAKFEIGFMVEPGGKLAQWALAKETGNTAKLHWPIVGMVKTTATNTTSITLEAPLTQAINQSAQITITPPVGSPVTATLSANAAVSDSSLSVDSVNVVEGSVITLVQNSDLWNQHDSTSIPKGQATYFSWEVDYQGTGELAPGDSIDFLISDIICDLPPGQAFITLKYFNLGGYWDGEFMIPIERTPISIGQQTVGIGLEPDAFAGNCSMQIPYGTGFPDVGLLIGGDGEDQGYLKQDDLNNSALVFSNLTSDDTAILLFEDDKNDSGVNQTFCLNASGSMQVGSGDMPELNPGIMVFPGFSPGVQIGQADANADEITKLKAKNYALFIGRNGTGDKLYIAGSGNNGNPAMTIDSTDLTTIKHLEISSGDNTQRQQVPLHVKNYSWPGIVKSSATLFEGTADPYSILDYPLSIKCDAGIYAPQYLIPSDERVKTVKGLSDTNKNLNTLNQLKIRDYEYRDQAAKGNAIHTGVIAQELAEVMPNAVSLQTDFIPDIYTTSTQVAFDAEEESLTIHLEKAHGLKVRDKVRLISESGAYEKNVIEVLSETAFKVGEWETEVSEVFVYGREVDDFHTVNYDAITMLGVSATQQLSKEVDALKEENQVLKEANQALEQKLETEIAALKAAIAQLSPK